MLVAACLCGFCIAPISAAAASTAVASAQRVLVGAIRWDGWHGSQSEVGRVLQTTLDPIQWRYRLPFYARISPDGHVEIDGSSQQVVDEEIRQASAAGLDYFAFVTYPAGTPMSLGLDRYLSSPIRSRIHFCLITEALRWKDPAFRKRVEDLMAEPGYLTVLNRRPVLFLGFLDEDTIAAQWGSARAFRKALDDLRRNLRRRGFGELYLVIMDFHAVPGALWAERLGADAISAYATEGGGRGAPYAALAAHTEHFWNDCLKTGRHVVPLVMTGWDRRPRVMHPHPWEPWQKPGVGIEKYYQTATPQEIAEHLLHAIRWIGSHADADPPRLILIYAWNENDEGGWLVPTVAEGNARLRALRAALERVRMPK
ncbi:MAG: hypothetical protein ACP5VE_08525 [Chthonomonadales bacterium]